MQSLSKLVLLLLLWLLHLEAPLRHSHSKTNEHLKRNLNINAGGPRVFLEKMIKAFNLIEDCKQVVPIHSLRISYKKFMLFVFLFFILCYFIFSTNECSECSGFKLGGNFKTTLVFQITLYHPIHFFHPYTISDTTLIAIDWWLRSKIFKKNLANLNASFTFVASIKIFD